ncbi:DUF4240 domain-containing protein [Clostridium botulinum]|uniref:DUF4240 domain-containing protein n=1 Tax=Clostridium botulinum TaxID=1491 RepID=UPI001C9B4A3F|nr:DUF4240 domain-containing protein [Clostridium botulinum]MBY6838730.1 DUF4240 domain-containing protein [Clostridium botulinum]
MIKNYRETVWKIIDESKEGVKYNPEKQKEKLYCILNKRYTRDNIEMLLQEFSTIMNEYIGGKDFDLLHKSNGGIVNRGDDCFYIDFASWLVGQGRELYEDYLKRGITAILVYIANNEFEHKHYEYECMMNAFFNY